ncbi:unnamed protein product, partial [Ixodes persulcatus]
MQSGTSVSPLPEIPHRRLPPSPVVPLSRAELRRGPIPSRTCEVRYVRRITPCKRLGGDIFSQVAPNFDSSDAFVAITSGSIAPSSSATPRRGPQPDFLPVQR